jgi:hypothetical protein
MKKEYWDLLWLESKGWMTGSVFAAASSVVTTILLFITTFFPKAKIIFYISVLWLIISVISLSATFIIASYNVWKKISEELKNIETENVRKNKIRSNYIEDLLIECKNNIRVLDDVKREGSYAYSTSYIFQGFYAEKIVIFEKSYHDHFTFSSSAISSFNLYNHMLQKLQRRLVPDKNINGEHQKNYGIDNYDQWVELNGLLNRYKKFLETAMIKNNNFEFEYKEVVDIK